MSTAINTLRCESTNPRAIRAAEAFPKRLDEVHQGRIVLRNDAVYRGAKEHIDVVCTVCDHPWSPRSNNLISGPKSGCPECTHQRKRDSAGTLRCRAVTPEEQARARQLSSEGWGPTAIGRELGRYQSTISRWLDAEQRERKRQYDAERWKDKAYREHKRQRKKAWFQTDHGKASGAAAGNKRRDYAEEWETNAADDLAKTKEIHAEKNRLNRLAGYIKYHVDHIRPLSVGGPNLWFNLQIITAAENQSKNNTFRPEDQILYARRLCELIKAG